ncbi:MAG: DUF134 domain-containing protein [Candidatus Omnitrophica bacterium]|nr:DUF134 domain-containing protein [Candidatus Omnitrophota bacterium]MDD5352272.1 DUF134 domain-containing protein [Candidatus Omnitrophota bacterium]MDD5549871.1 DUF134 domain-containing protein [Candidatus Omnitrophota bacterium]
MEPKGRPKKLRLVENTPKITQFSPRGKPGRPDEVELGIDQFEVLRLVDYLGLNQTQAAEQIGLSRQTVGRILRRARKTISDALITGKIIRISGGDIKLKKASPEGPSKS